MVNLTYDKIENADVMPEVANVQTGATVIFFGTARELTDGRMTRELQYDAYPEMAVRMLQQIEQEACLQWPLNECQIVHRLGRVRLGETCVVVRVTSGHRREAFTAAAWIMDEIKQRVPIWKCEHWANGTKQWVYPDGTQSEGQTS